MLLALSVGLYSQEYFLINNGITVYPSSDGDLTRLLFLTGCPESNEYQDIYKLDCSSNGKWNKRQIQENDNSYLELGLDENALAKYTGDFYVGYSFVHSPKEIDIDFSDWKDSNGQWKDVPEYDKGAQLYKDNTKQSGDLVVPNNETIKMLSDELWEEVGGINVMAYAERCYYYVAQNYRYLNPNTGLHPLSELLANGGGDCGNLSSIYISLLRAKGIPARHVIAVGADDNFHVWSEFYVQDRGWIPVDVTYKNGNPQGNYFGKYHEKFIVVQKGVVMDYRLLWVGNVNIGLLQGYYWWYWYKNPVNVSVEMSITSQMVDYTDVVNVETNITDHPVARKYIIDGQLVIRYGEHWYNAMGVIVR